LPTTEYLKHDSACLLGIRRLQLYLGIDSKLKKLHIYVVTMLDSIVRGKREHASLPRLIRLDRQPFTDSQEILVEQSRQ